MKRKRDSKNPSRRMLVTQIKRRASSSFDIIHFIALKLCVIFSNRHRRFSVNRVTKQMQLQFLSFHLLHFFFFFFHRNFHNSHIIQCTEANAYTDRNGDSIAFISGIFICCSSNSSLIVVYPHFSFHSYCVPTTIPLFYYYLIKLFCWIRKACHEFMI